MPYYPKSCLKSRPVGCSDPKKLTNNYYITNNNSVPVEFGTFLFPPGLVEAAAPKKAAPKKRVSWAPGTVNHERESKAYNNQNVSKRDGEGAPKGWSRPRPGLPPTLSQPPRFLRLAMPGPLPADQLPSPALDTSSSPGRSSPSATAARVLEETRVPAGPAQVLDNDYIRFTHAKRCAGLLEKGTAAGVRSKRLFQLVTQLKNAHQDYNMLEGLEKRDSFLIQEILQRYILALDLALTEGYTGFALELTHTMYDTTKYMLPLYSHIFYKLDGTHTKLPVLVQDPAFVQSLPPVIFALNRISESRARSDNSCLNLETLLVKLQLEMITLTLAPIKSVIFRAVLEIVSGTAHAAYSQLMEAEAETWIKWVNNSNLRNDYLGILRKLGMADRVGARGSLDGIDQQRSITASIYNPDLQGSPQQDSGNLPALELDFSPPAPRN